MYPSWRCKLSFDKLFNRLGWVVDERPGQVFVNWDYGFSNWLPEWLVEEVEEVEKDDF